MIRLRSGFASASRRWSLSSALVLAIAGVLLACAAPCESAGTTPAPVIADHMEIGEGAIYYEVYGEGFPLVLIHDGLAHSEVWDAQVSAFAADYKVIRYDRRGYGRSDQPEAPFSNVKDLQTLLETIGVDRAVLVGSSAGGGLCIDFALDHPEMVEAMVLSGPVVSGLGYSFHFMKRAYGNFGPDMTTTLDLWADDPYAVAPGNDEARRWFRELLHANPQNLDFAKHRFVEDRKRAALDRLGEITSPTLLITGDRDIPDVHAHMGAIEAGITGARRVLIEGAGHLSYLERPEAFNAAVREFLSLLSLAPGSPRLSDHPSPPWDTFRNGFAAVTGTDLYYEIMGPRAATGWNWGRDLVSLAEPVILIHGGAIDHRMWDDQFATLSRQFHVIRYDIRGHGLSLSPWGRYCNYEDLRALMTELGIDRAHLVGLSLGCRVAVDLAIADPERVASLVLCSPGISGYDFNAPEEQEYMQRIGAAWGAADFAQAAEEFVRGWADGPHRTPEQMPPAVRAKIKGMALGNVLPNRDLGQGLELDPPAVGRLGEIHAPTLAILGDLDMPGIHEIVRMVGLQVPAARIVKIDGVAHMVNMERGEQFDQLVIEFLRAQ